MQSRVTVDLKPYIVLADGTTVPRVMFVGGDKHYPFQHGPAIALAHQAAEDAGVNTIVYQGDTLDLYSASRFSKDFNKPWVPKGLKQEFEPVIADFDWACRVAEDVILIEGNHENRWAKFVGDNPALEGLTLQDIIKPDPKIQWLPNKSQVCIGDDFTVEHGDHLKGALTKHSAYNVAINYPFQTTVYGHDHKVGMDLETRFLSKGTPHITGAYGVGHLADTRKMDYVRDSKTQMGFAMVTWYQVGPKKRWQHRVELIHIDLDRSWRPSFFFRGKVYA